MKKTLSAIILVLLTLQSVYSCTYSLVMQDTYGDGWNGAYLTITANGTTVLNTNGFFTSGPVSSTYTFNANDGENVVITFTGGSWDSECSYTITSPTGAIASSTTAGNMNDGNSWNFTASCPAPTCTDGIWNGNETYIDCGGPDCPPCTQCANGIQDGDEEGVDCGGTNCPACIVEWNIDDVDNQTINFCNGTLYDSGGPNGGYASNESYSVTFCSPNGENIQITFVTLDTEGGYDAVSVYDQNMTLIGEYDEDNPPGSIVSPGTCITIEFSSDGSVQQSGFEIQFSCISPTCDDGIWNGNETYIDCGGPDCPPCSQCSNGIQDGDEEGVDCGGTNCPVCVTEWNIDDVDNQTLNFCNGTLYDSGGPSGVYSASEDYSVTFCSPGGENITVDIASINTESCCDHIFVYDGNSTSSPLIGQYQGTTTGSVLSTGTCITIQFTSDGSVQNNGFEIQLSCITPTCDDGLWNGFETYIDCGGPDCPPCSQCSNGIQDADEEGIDCGGTNCPACPQEWNIDDVNGTTINTCGGTLYDSGGPSGTYQASEDYSVTFCSSNGDCLDIDFSGMNTESCCDHIFVYDGSNAFADLIGEYQGTTTPSTLTTSGNCVTIRFTSDGSVQYDGFEINVTCTSNCYVPPPPPPNDDPCFAEYLLLNETCSYSTYTTEAATSTSIAPPSCGSYNGGDVWFYTTVDEAGLQISTNGIDLTDIEVALYTGTCDNLAEFRCMATSFDDPFADVMVTSVDMMTGQDVWVRVWCPNSTEEGDFQICSTLPPPPSPQDCLGAIPLCESQYYTEESYVGTGNYPEEIDSNPSCLSSGEKNDVWYVFTVQSPGALAFTITPNDTWDDYDWAVYDLTNANCEDIYDDASLEISCNYSGTSGATGPNGGSTESSQGAGGTPFNSTLNVQVGGTYVINVSNFSSSQSGYTINFDQSTADIYDDVDPMFTGVENPIPCGDTGITVYFSENIRCLSVQNTDFSITGPGGPYTITGVSSPTCELGAVYGSEYTVYVDPPIMASGIYTISLVDTVYDVCDNVSLVGTEITFDLITLVLTADHTDVTCFGGDDGSAWVSVQGGTDPLTYSWSDGNSNDTLLNVIAGNYSASITDALGCTVDTTFIITEPLEVIVSASSTPDEYNLSNGTATATVQNGVSPLTYIWNDPSAQTDQVATNLSEGTYCVTVTDSNNCWDSTCVYVEDVGMPVANFSYNGDQCFLGHGFDFTNLGSSQTTGATYSWQFTNGTPATSTDENPTGITWASEGTYAVTQTIILGAISVDTTINITIFPQPDADMTGVDPLCYGGSDGYAYPTPVIGTSPFTYIWDAASGNQTTATANNLSAGTYSVTITDSHGCTVKETIKLFEPEPLTSTTGSVNANCDLSDGTAVVHPAGGTSPYSVIWSGGVNPTDTVITGLSEGFYDVTITDANGCTLTDDVIVSNNEGVFAEITGSSNISCHNACDGSITVEISNGDPNFTYIWSTGNNSTDSDSAMTYSNLCAGYYRVTVSDSRGCADVDSLTLTQPNPLNYTFETENVSCFGGIDGSIDLNVIGGTLPYQYAWSNSSASQDLNGIPAGTYSTTITDNNGCTLSADTIITQPSSPLHAYITPIHVKCYQGNDGYANLFVSGGTQPYFYSWSNGGVSEDQSGLYAGTYSVTITDANLCVVDTSVIITQPLPVILSTSSTQTTCYGRADGTATVNVVSGGTPNFYFYWSNSMAAYGTTSTASYLESGIYTVTVIDHNNCTTDTTITVKEPDKITISTSPNKTICTGNTTTLQASATGGTPSYTYIWSNGNTSASIQVTPSETSTYSVFVKDVFNCSSLEYTVKVVVLPPISAELISDYDSVCKGDPVTLSTDYIGGKPPYYFYVDSTQVSVPYIVHPELTHMYTLQVTDSCGSPAGIDDKEITVIPPPSNNYFADKTEGCVPFKVQFNETSMYSGQTFYWVFNDFNSMNTSTMKNPSHTFNEPGEYTIELTVTSPEGCTSTVTSEQMITVNPNPIAAFTVNPTTTSLLDPEIRVINTSEGHVSCMWDFGDNTGTINDCDPVHSYEVAGTFDITLIVANEHGCRDTIVYSGMQVDDAYTLYVPTAFTPDGDGYNDLFSPKITGLKDGSYKLMVYNRWGELVYETSTYGVDEKGTITIGWDGRIKGKKFAETGVYTWQLQFIDKTNELEHKEIGSVTVIR